MAERASPADRRALSLGLAALAVSGILFACQAPEPGEDRSSGDSVGGVEAPADLAESASETGVHQTGPYQYDVVIDAYEGLFVPREVRVPVGAEVTFRVTSKDIAIHGFSIEGTEVALELRPTTVTEVTHTFAEAGEYAFACHIYCTGSHEFMRGMVVAE
jgi:heme/copper-type cytochrome/quinol oxidase subunit 2